MSFLSQFVTVIQPTRSITNSSSGGGTVETISNPGAKSVASGSTTANVLSTILTISGQAEVPILALSSGDTISRTVRLQVTVDGTIVFDATSGTLVQPTQGIFAAGCRSPYLQSGLPIRCSSSLVVKCCTNATETNGATLYYVAHGY